MSSKILKNRIKATRNINQMTRAMEAVSAVKMRRSQSLALSARPYALSALKILRAVRSSATNNLSAISPLLEKRPVKRITLVIITSDKGLAGAFNSSVLRRAEKFLSGESRAAEVSIIAIGKKGRDYFARRKAKLAAEFIGAGDYGSIAETTTISDLVAKLFIKKETDEVVLIYTHFQSALKQEVVERTLLPFTDVALEELAQKIGGETDEVGENFLFEPTAARIVDGILPALLAVEVFHAVLEANASEHSSRMIAMKNASENASDLIDELVRDFNKARQAAITKELAEITAGGIE